MQVTQRRAQVLAEVAQVRGAESGGTLPAAVEEVAQGGTGEILQDQQRRLPVSGDDVIVGADQVRMGQREQQARFARQMAAGRGVGGGIGSERLDETPAVAV